MHASEPRHDVPAQQSGSPEISSLRFEAIGQAVKAVQSEKLLMMRRAAVLTCWETDNATRLRGASSSLMHSIDSPLSTPTE